MRRRLIVGEKTEGPSQAGSYSYKAVYSGDASDSPATDACEGPLVVTEVPAAVVNVVKFETAPGAGGTVTAGQSTPITYKLAVTNSGSAAARATS